MARARQRVRLQDGLWLDLNKFLREGFGPPGNEARIISTQWTSNLRGELATAIITIQKVGENQGYLKMDLVGRFEQRLDLIAQPRHFGGRQWYIRCPATGHRCSVVWLPPGATHFCSRQAWGKQVAYSTQFEAPFDRAISAREKVKSRLIGDLDPCQGMFPPKPKWMRWRTYERLGERYQFQQRKIDHYFADFMN